ncbi:multiple inositol polyphosphate phosphatase 1-like [Ceratina calcarata]|uniref:Multiple inositol polyphosphate phosphatase 1 n=1 Tax=Ceratina calcarata TaxID=156304 RepID=A0AAJ7J1Y9_9HYME|nr:multiple inositol polyphosphate phosphatase 1-like [Ceratina calcarata]
MLHTKIFAILALVCINNRIVLSDYCYHDDENPYLYYSTLTAYENEHGLIKNVTVPNCEPVQIWMLARHGTRYPTKKEIKSMKNDLPDLQESIIKNHKKHGRGSLCSSDLRELESWELDPSVRKSNKKYLTKQGEEDLLSLARRFKNYFPELLRSRPDEILEDGYKFRSTDTQRTVLSMERFINGLFGNVTIGNTEVIPSSEDYLLTLYKNCKAWAEQSNNEDDEVDKFLNTSQFTQVVHNVSRRLGFKENLNSDDVLLMHNACAFESAWYIGKKSPWCTAFTADELKVIEYKMDLHYYYHASYGRNLSRAVGCPPLQNMFNHFVKLENGDSEEPRGIFYFAHSSGIQLLLTAMGIAEDATPLKANNFENMRNRTWNTSHLVPFAANLAAIFYKCDSGNKVRFYLNEKPLDYDGCEAGVCDWEYLKKKMEFAFSCDTDFCSK